MDQKQCHELAKALIPMVGGKENIVEVSHCVTRLRFILRDESLADTEGIESFPGVLKVSASAGQYQVVIGLAVSHVYDELMTELQSEETNPPAPDQKDQKTEAETVKPDVGKEVPTSGKNSFRMAVGKVGAFLTACIQPLIPMLVSVGMIRSISMVLGPTMLSWLSADSGTYRILSMVSDAGFASLPIFIAWSASNYLKTNTVLALFYGAFLIWPDLASLLNSGDAVTLYGLPVPAATYTNQVVPVMLIIVTMYLVERLLKKVLPESMEFVGIPMLETIIMLPLMLCAVGPLGTLIGNGIADGAMALYRVAGPLSVALVGAFFIFICATGMHTAMIATAFVLIEKQGYDSVALVGAAAAAYACFGVYLAYTVLVKDSKKRAVGLGAFLAFAVGGVAEPGMYTLLFTDAHLMCIEIVSAFFGSLYLGIQGAQLYAPGASNFMAVVQFSGGSESNFRNAVIGCAISFVIGLVLTAVMQIRVRNMHGGEAGLDKKEKKNA